MRGVTTKKKYIYYHQYIKTRGPGSVVSIATGYGPDGPGIEKKIMSRKPAAPG